MGPGLAIEDIRFAVRRVWTDVAKTSPCGEVLYGGGSEITLLSEEELQVKVNGVWVPVRTEIIEDDSEKNPMGCYGIRTS